MEEEYVIERIVGKKILKYKKGKPVYYLIKWKDYGDEYQSWELKSSLSPEIVKEYEMEIRNPKPGNTFLISFLSPPTCHLA